MIMAQGLTGGTLSHAVETALGLSASRAIGVAMKNGGTTEVVTTSMSGSAMNGGATARLRPAAAARRGSPVDPTMKRRLRR